MVLRHALTDTRFSITQEFTGAPARKYVVRFCGEWRSSHATREAAESARTRAIELHRQVIESYGRLTHV